jgi:cystathionine beta-lyase
MKWNGVAEGHIGAAVAEMDLGTAPAIQQALHSLIDREAYGYLPERFAIELKEACAAWHSSVYGWEVRPEQVLPVGDVLVALEITIRWFMSPEHPIIVPTPAYMPFLDIPRNIGCEVIEVPMILDHLEGWHLDLAGIRDAFSAGAELLILCNPHNPTGHVHRDSELHQLSHLVDEYGGRVFSDEIHSPVVFPGHRHVPYASISEIAAGHTITATASSKAWNTPGLKCAQVIHSNDAALEKWQRVAGKAAFGASNPGAVASSVAYREGGPWLEGALEYLNRNRILMGELIRRDLPEVEYYPPEGTYLAWLDFRRVGLGDDPSQAVRDRAGVRTSPGPAFGEAGRGWLRFNFAMPTPFLEEAFARIVRLVKDC